MVGNLKSNIKRLSDMSTKSRLLPIAMQHAYQYSKWDAIHEPYNVVENILQDNDKVFKASTPSLDFSLDNGRQCFVASVILHPGDVGPQTVEIYVSNMSESWSMVKKFTCNKSGPTTLTMPGENIAKYLRIRCINNVRGGNLTNVRFVQIKGLPADEIPSVDFYQ